MIPAYSEGLKQKRFPNPVPLLRQIQILITSTSGTELKPYPCTVVTLCPAIRKSVTIRTSMFSSSFRFTSLIPCVYLKESRHNNPLSPPHHIQDKQEYPLFLCLDTHTTS